MRVLTYRGYVLTCQCQMLSDLVGDDWPKNLQKLSKLREFEHDTKVLRRVQAVQRSMKKRFAAWVGCV